MNIGDKILVESTDSIEEITNILPVVFRDDGEEQWYEICDSTKTEYVAIIGKDKAGRETMTIIKKSEENIDLITDII